LSKIFATLFSVLALAFGLTCISLLTVNKSTALQSFAQLSTLPGLALSVRYFEPRNRFYADENERFFIDMRPISTMDFIYAK